jgi:LysR family nitrogen assimilation transcriptional regulator
MTLQQLSYFVRVAELGSFTRAALVLGVAQPALSRQIRLLEVELRQSLLLRNGRGATPTEAGEHLLAHARGILHQVERAREDVGRAGGALSGRVTLGLPPTLARCLTVPLFRAFREQLPGAALAITENLSTAMTEALAQGRIDVALLHNAEPSPELDLLPLFEEELCVVEAGQSRAATETIAFASFGRLPLVLPSRPNAIRMRVETQLASRGLKPRVAHEVDGVLSILELVADGVGAAVLPRSAVAVFGKPDALRLLTLESPGLTTRVSLATSALRPSTLTQSAALELIQVVALKELAPYATALRAGKQAVE